MTTTIQKISAVAAGIGLLAISGVALAQTPAGDATTTETAAASNYPAPMIVAVDQNGFALVRGVVQSASAGQLTISSWGGTWTVASDGSTASAVPAGLGGGTANANMNDLSGVRVGDFVGVNGYMGQGQGQTIQATFVRDWTTNPYTGALGTGTASGTIPTIYGGTMIPATGGTGSDSGSSSTDTNASGMNGTSGTNGVMSSSTGY